MARPKLDPAVTQRIIELIRAGNCLEVAATTAGIHRTTLQRWLRNGRDQARGRYKRFLISVERAQAECESRDVALIAKAAASDWKAAAWRLERRLPRRYGPRIQATIQEELNAMVDVLEKGLDRETFLKVLEVVCSYQGPGPAGLPPASDS